MITFYKGTPRVTGSACSLHYSTSVGCFFLELIKQSGWNAKAGPNGSGVFITGKDNPTKHSKMKISTAEACELLNAIDSGGSVKLYHSFGGSSSQLFFGPYEKDPKLSTLNLLKTSAEDKTATGKTSILIGLKAHEVRLVREYLLCGLQEIFKTKPEVKKPVAEKTPEPEPETSPEVVEDAPIF